MAYSEEQKTTIVDSICTLIINGKTLRFALKENDVYSDTFYRWLDAEEEKSKQYARATELRAETMAEELLEIADNQENDIVVIDGVEKTNHDVIGRARLRLDTRKWLMSKMFSKKYGEKIQTEQTIKIEQPLFGDE